MWVAKIKLDGSQSLLGKRTKKYNVKITGYPLSWSFKEGDIYIYLAGEVFGEEKAVDRFEEDLRKSKEVLYLERQGRFFIALTKKDRFFGVFYNPKFIHARPVIINEKGENLFEIGSFNRNQLIEFINITEKKYGAELVSIRDLSIKNIAIVSPYPEITEKQRKVFELALKEGYYNFPKKINLNELAGKLNISFSTCRTHLKKAERKALEFVFNYL